MSQGSPAICTVRKAIRHFIETWTNRKTRSKSMCKVSLANFIVRKTMRHFMATCTNRETTGKTWNLYLNGFHNSLCDQQRAKAENCAILVVLSTVIHLQRQMAWKFSSHFLYQLQVCQQDTAWKIASRACACKLTTKLPVSDIAEAVYLAGRERILQPMTLVIKAFRLSGNLSLPLRHAVHNHGQAIRTWGLTVKSQGPTTKRIVWSLLFAKTRKR